MSSLVEAVPVLMAKARRRRSAAAAAPPITFAGRAREVIPKLAVATVVAVALATTVSCLERDAAGAGSTSYDSLVLTGPDNGNADSTDILLDAVTKGDE